MGHMRRALLPPSLTILNIDGLEAAPSGEHLLHQRSHARLATQTVPIMRDAGIRNLGVWMRSGLETEKLSKSRTRKRSSANQTSMMFLFPIAGGLGLTHRTMPETTAYPVSWLNAASSTKQRGASSLELLALLKTRGPHPELV